MHWFLLFSSLDSGEHPYVSPAAHDHSFVLRLASSLYGIHVLTLLSVQLSSSLVDAS